VKAGCFLPCFVHKSKWNNHGAGGPEAPDEDLIVPVPRFIRPRWRLGFDLFLEGGMEKIHVSLATDAGGQKRILCETCRA
jgi:hypothetical protein